MCGRDLNWRQFLLACSTAGCGFLHVYSTALTIAREQALERCIDEEVRNSG